MQVNKKIGLAGGVVLLSVVIFSFMKEEEPEKPAEVPKEDVVKFESFNKETHNPIKISAQSQTKPKKELAKILKKMKQQACEGEDCFDPELEFEDTGGPEGMHISVQVSNTGGSRAIVSSQLCSIYASLDQEDFAEFDIHQSCDIFVYKMDGAFRSYTEEHFVEYTSGDEAELSFTFPEERIGGMGVGIYKMEDGFEISYVYPGSPADELGLEQGDIIVEVNGETTYDLNLDDFLQLTTGYEGTKAEFRLKKDGKNQPPHVFTRKVMDFN